MGKLPPDELDESSDEGFTVTVAWPIPSLYPAFVAVTTIVTVVCVVTLGAVNVVVK
jgi:hypothetical protein